MTSPYYADDGIELHHGDSLEVLQGMPDGSVNSCVTSPPYFGLRDYGIEGQYGLEASPAEYVETMRVLFSEVRRVLADDGTLWLNLGDSYSAAGGHTDPGQTSTLAGRRVQLMQGMPTKGSDRPSKSLLGIPWRVAFALQDSGWILRNAIVWNKPNPMPSSIADRLNTTYEHVFLLSKSPRYWFDLDVIKVPSTGRAPGNTPEAIAAYGKGAGTTGASRRWGGNETSTLLDIHETRNPGDVWTISTKPFSEAHFAVMPPELAERCILAGCKPGGTVLDPFSGSGTTGMVAQRHGRKYVGIDLNSDYLDMSLRTRLQQAAFDFDGAA